MRLSLSHIPYQIMFPIPVFHLVSSRTLVILQLCNIVYFDPIITHNPHFILTNKNQLTYDSFKVYIRRNFWHKGRL